MAEARLIYKTEEEIALIRESSLLVSKTIALVGKQIAPGVSTLLLDKLAEEFIRDSGAEPAFKGYSPSSSLSPFPYTLCISVNEEVVHGMPSDKKVLKEGDIVSIDCGVKLNGYFGDSAYTFAVGEISSKKKRLLDATKASLYKAIDKAVAGNYLGDVSNAVQMYAESMGYSIVREMVGHGIGASLHEAPEVPNYGRRRSGPLLMEGLVIAIEPMVNMGRAAIDVTSDGWVIFAKDKLPSAHFEHTIVVRKDKAEILSTFDFIENN